jgi:hypothetical protein
VQAYFTEAAVRSNQTNSKVTNMAKKRNYIWVIFYKLYKIETILIPLSLSW